MAKIQQEIIMIKVSQIARDDETVPPAVTEDIAQALAQVAQELVGSGAVVELEQAQ